MTKVIPNTLSDGDCSSFSTMTDAGSLPSATQEPAHKDDEAYYRQDVLFQQRGSHQCEWLHCPVGLEMLATNCAVGPCPMQPPIVPHEHSHENAVTTWSCNAKYDID